MKQSILKPLLTEKASLLTSKNVYTFKISEEANKYKEQKPFKLRSDYFLGNKFVLSKILSADLATNPLYNFPVGS